MLAGLFVGLFVCLVVGWAPKLGMEIGTDFLSCNNDRKLRMGTCVDFPSQKIQEIYDRIFEFPVAEECQTLRIGRLFEFLLKKSRNL